MVQNFKAIPSACPKLWNLNQENHSKMVLFLVKSLQNWGYNSSLIEMLALPNIGHMTTSTI